MNEFFLLLLDASAKIIIVPNKSYYWDFPGGPVVRLRASTAGGAGSILGWGTKIPHAAWGVAKKKKS